MMDERASNPVKAVAILVSGFIVFFLIFTYISTPLIEVWDATEEAAVDGTPDIWSTLWTTWLTIIVLVLVFLGVGFIAYLHQREREVQIYG